MCRFLKRTAVLVGLALAPLGQAQVKTYKTYEMDWEPLKREPALYQEYVRIFDPKQAEKQSQADLKRGYEIIESVLKKNPKWLDGYWQLGSIAFQWGGSYTDEKDLPFAREIFVRGQKATETCLKYDPNQFLCKLFLGSSIGSIGTIDGVLSSLINAKKIEKLWKDVIDSEYNYNFFAEVSAQGSVRYGLGIFYRLIPDMFLIDWLFDVRGSLDKSIAMHKESIALDGTNVCADLMLAVSLVCKAKGERTSREGREGFSLLEKSSKAQPAQINMKICAVDAKKILAEPSKACGYSTAKQQEVDEKAVEKQKLKK